MSKHLVIVESPAKARTIERYLGPDYKVLASYGHVRQLPSKKGSIDIEHDFAPKYEPIDGNRKHVAAIKKELKTAEDLYLATDLDREGEAIAWHLSELVGAKPEQIKRITFDEITKSAITEAVKNPRGLDEHLIAAQETRQSLDYLYGFTLSPFLWKKIRFGLSAGRVQSVALRLIVEREREIEAFKAKEYWTLDALLSQPKEADARMAQFGAQLFEDNGKKLGQFDLTKDRGAELAAEIPQHPLSVSSVETKDRKRSPSPPFTTSTLQQEASRKLTFTARRTMQVAQKLYENGFITYMRTDSVHLAESAVREARETISKQYGKAYVPESARYYKSKKGAQEAHEAIRPTSFAKTPESLAGTLTPEQIKLYGLIWKRALASQMADAKLAQTTALIKAGADGAATLKATGSQVTFPGFIKAYLEGTDNVAADDSEKLLPQLTEQDPLDLKEIKPERHETQPPPRYTEASLVKTLEEYGIGRPSTYASIISTIQGRGYVKLEERRFFPQDIGMVVSDVLTKQFTKYVDYDFTAQMEEQLDSVAEGQQQKVAVLSDWWKPFIKNIETADPTPVFMKTGKKCPECKEGDLGKRFGKFGMFIGCNRYPDCKYMEPILSEEDKVALKGAQVQADQEKCPECGSAMEARTGPYGVYIACTRYPECKGRKPFIKSTGIECPKCKKGELAERKANKGRMRGKIFYSCSRYPDCDFAVWQEPVKEPCPKCQSLVTKQGGKSAGLIACTECDWVGAPDVETPSEPAPAAETA